jgi:hypothetical protein
MICDHKMLHYCGICEEIIFLNVGHGCWYFWSLSANFDCLSKVNGMKR